MLTVICGPSGIGKTTLANWLVEEHGFKKVVTYTTRFPREGEVDGVHYHFISTDEFVSSIKLGTFTEWEYNYGNFYGTKLADLDSASNSEDKYIIVLDIRGANTVAEELERVRVFGLLPDNSNASRMLADRILNENASANERVERLKTLDEEVFQIEVNDKFTQVNVDLNWDIEKFGHVFYSFFNYIYTADYLGSFKNWYTNYYDIRIKWGDTHS